MTDQDRIEDTPKRQDAVASTSDKTTQWLQANRAAMDAWNAYVAQHGLPLAHYREF